MLSCDDALILSSIRNNKVYMIYKTCIINDPLGQTHSLASSEHCFRFKFLLFLKSGDGQTDGRHVQKTMIIIGRDCG